MHSSAPLIVDVLIPARDQADRLPDTLAALPYPLLRSIVVVDNDSRDATAALAEDAGAVVLREPRVGRGAACLTGIRHLAALPIPPDVVVFMSGDGSDDPEDIARLLLPITQANAELVIGVRARQHRRAPHSRMVLGLIGAIYGHRFQDLGPMRAIRFPALVALALTDPSEAFNVEMQVKSVRIGLRIEEIPVKTVRARNRSLRAVSNSMEITGRAVFHILRHSTLR